MTKTVNCEVECLNGCILEEECPNKEFVAETSKFIETTPLDKMLEMAEIARLKKLSEPPKWIIPDDF
ncbi:hypothetical protein [Geminocystis sp. NIES-3709]|uniref:hypothetical protein n=1 Tax=Geminocystis sp. NIES-3709 TaxID=1617448 RepID=UPI0005FC7D88|nr:hypothetical protein [Geminocystis sp. NIES-3709]BAQ64057.1 hypothetical protein GM3709_822 [Geminocystis sp. NIES-3709]